jgi:uncharacterized protein YkwD
MRKAIVGLVAAAAGMWIAGGGAAAAPSAAPAHASASSLVLQLINHDRASAGLGPVSLNARLSAVALGHSIDMANRNYLSHDAPGGISPYDRMGRAGVTYHIAGENIGYDTGTSHWAMLRAIDVAMLNSPEHRANLLRRSFLRVGIGIAVIGDSLYVTEDFTG